MQIVVIISEIMNDHLAHIVSSVLYVFKRTCIYQMKVKHIEH
jgi:hypothetical protein